MLEKPKEYKEVKSRQNDDTIYAEDINQIISNIELIKGGSSDEAPAGNIKDIYERLKKSPDIKNKEDKVNQEILENLVAIDSSEQIEKDENGIIYSQDINLKKALAEKINRKENEIEIINFNLMPNAKAGNISFQSSYSFDPIIDFEDGLFYLAFVSTQKGEDNIGIAIQVADDFTEDIANYGMPTFITTETKDYIATKYKATLLFLFLYSETFTDSVNVYSVANLFGISETKIDAPLNASSNTASINETVYGGYYSRVEKLLKNSPTVNFANISICDTSSKLLYGDNIKIRIKAISYSQIIFNGSIKYDVVVRYKI